MIRTKVTVDLKPTRAAFDRMSRRGKYAYANQALQDMNRYVPYLSSDLRQTGSVGMGNKTLIWNTPYARAQFYGSNGIVSFHNYTTAGTGKRWDLKAQSIHSEQWAQLIARELK